MKEMRLEMKEMRLEMKEMRLEIKSELMDMKTELLAAIHAINGPEKATKPRAAEATANRKDSLKELDEEIQWLELVTLQLRFEIKRMELEIAEMDGSEQNKIDDIDWRVAVSRTRVEDANVDVLCLKIAKMRDLDPQELLRLEEKLTQEFFWLEQNIDERGVYDFM